MFFVVYLGSRSSCAGSGRGWSRIAALPHPPSRRIETAFEVVVIAQEKARHLAGFCFGAMAKHGHRGSDHIWSIIT